MRTGLMRRAGVLGLIAGVAAAGPGADAPATGAAADAALRWTLLYVGAEDCAPCRAWRDARWDRERVVYRGAPLRFLELRAERSAGALDDTLWPEALRPYRAAIPRDAGLPLWMLAQEDRVLVRTWGTSRWDTEMAPALRGIAGGRGRDAPRGEASRPDARPRIIDHRSEGRSR
jgi:hypothetical protein